jgi:hypothetical protein
LFFISRHLAPFDELSWKAIILKGLVQSSTPVQVAYMQTKPAQERKRRRRGLLVTILEEII